MIVDDELPALKMAESVLKTFDDITICGAYSDPDELLSSLSTAEVDLLLLDMKMPGMHGLELAGRIQELKPEAQIVFVTAYDDFAVNAFETEALDYIMKPITAERMQKTLERYRKRCGEQKPDEMKERVLVRSFGRFSVEKEQGRPLSFRTAKAEELLAFLLHHRGNPVSKDMIMEELWYDRDAERAQSMLYTTLYQLRKDLDGFGLANVIQHSRKEGGSCRLLWTPDQWDCEEFIEGYWKYKTGKISIEQTKRIMEFHKDGYLAGNGYPWAAERQNELELNCAELLEELADFEVSQHRFESALLHLKSWAELFPYSELVHIRIVALHLLMNQKEAAKDYARKAKDMFDEELGVDLQIDMEALAADPGSAFKE